MNKLKILVVEGNTKEENVNFNQAGCASQSENFSEHIKMHEPECGVDIIEPADNSSMERIISSLKKYNGIILGIILLILLSYSLNLVIINNYNSKYIFKYLYIIYEDWIHSWTNRRRIL